MAQPLSEERILEAALRLVDRDGLPALSMRRLGAELGVEAMSLYRYTPNKAALLAGLVGLIVAEIALPEPPIADWQAHLARVAHAFRAVLRAHPNAVPLVAVQPIDPAAPPSFILDTIRLLAEAGFGDRAPSVLQCVAVFTIGHALAEVGSPDPIPPGELPDTGYDFDSEFVFGLGALIAGFATTLPPAS